MIFSAEAKRASQPKGATGKERCSPRSPRAGQEGCRRQALWPQLGELVCWDVFPPGPATPVYPSTFLSFSPLPPSPQCCPGDASLYPEPCGAGQTFAQGGVWGSLLLPGSEPEQHCLFPPGHSVEGAAERRATGEFPCGEGCLEMVRWSEKGSRQEAIAGDRAGLRTEAK